MRKLRPTTQFKKDIKRAKSRGKDITKLEEIIQKIQMETPLDPRNNRHRLSGSLAPNWECHIEPDWLLIWDEAEEEIRLIRTGTHADLFR